MAAYYNEIDPQAAQWLRNLIAAGHIAPGEVDERSIRDVAAGDLLGFTQCHFFAGIGVWSHALRRAGWPDDRPVWTGSCPCQPFSSAGKGDGFADDRHLWPAWRPLIAERGPGVVLGEQVSGKNGGAWLDLVQADLEGLGYAFGPVVLPAAGFGAPHQRHRIFFVAESGRERFARVGLQLQPGQSYGALSQASGRGEVGGMAHASGARVRDCGRGPDARAEGRAQGEGLQRERLRDDAGDGGCGMADAERERGCGRQPGGEDAGDAGFWSHCDWLPCSDGKARPVEPGSFPLAHGASARVVRLRAYGNAIVAPVAEEFIRAYLDVKTPLNRSDG